MSTRNYPWKALCLPPESCRVMWVTIPRINLSQIRHIRTSISSQKAEMIHAVSPTPYPHWSTEVSALGRPWKHPMGTVWQKKAQNSDCGRKNTVLMDLKQHQTLSKTRSRSGITDSQLFPEICQLSRTADFQEDILSIRPEAAAVSNGWIL